MGALDIAKRLNIRHNVSIRVLDEATEKVISEHTGHNAATNSMLTGIAHYLIGDGVLNQKDILDKWIPKYISLGTMGLFSQAGDANGLPLGIGENASDNELKRYSDYMTHCPGYGADGYDENLNNDRVYLGLGPMFENREAEASETTLVQRGDINQDGVIDEKDLLILLDYIAGTYAGDLTEQQQIAADVNGDGIIDKKDVYYLRSYLAGEENKPGTYEYKSSIPTIRCELISGSYPRSQITYRNIVPESQSELEKTIDIVFSAYVSTGALKQFRGENNYIYITEAGLWSRPDWTNGGDNGLLAGYRIAPPDERNWKMAEYDADSETYSDSKECEENRRLLDKEIIRVGENQIVQVVWKIQLGGIEQLVGIEKLFPSDAVLRWTIYQP